MFVSQIGVPDFTKLTMIRACSLLEQHTLAKIGDRQARQDWLQEMDLPFHIDPAHPGLRALVDSGAAVDLADARDILNTEHLVSLQPHRETELRAALTKRRTPRMAADVARREAAQQAVTDAQRAADGNPPVSSSGQGEP